MMLRPFSKSGSFYKGNLHGHSSNSDGKFSVSEVIDAYKKRGYDFTCISDHLWIDNRFCAETVTDASKYNTHDFIAINSAELHTRGKKYDKENLWHLVANGLSKDFKPSNDEENIQDLIKRAKGDGAFISIAHPEWYSLTFDEAIMLKDCHSVEIYNHASTVKCNRGSGIYIADFLLNENVKTLLTSTDDSHSLEEDAYGGWVFVKTKELNEKKILKSLIKGDYYSSTGVVIYEVKLENRLLKLKFSSSNNIMVSGAGHTNISSHGYNLTKAELNLENFDSPFFRITISNQFGKYAWTNPYWFNELDLD